MPSPAASRARQGKARVNVTTLFIESGSPREIGCVERFNGKRGYELSLANSSKHYSRRMCSSNSGSANTTRADPKARWANGPPRQERSSMLRPFRPRLSEASRFLAIQLDLGWGVGQTSPTHTLRLVLSV
jgi:hypothetical protein